MEKNDPMLDALLNDRPIATEEPAAEPGVNPAANEPLNTNEPAPSEGQEPQPDAAAANPDTQVPTPTAASWITEASKSIGIEFKTEDDLKNYFNKAKSYDDLEGRATTLSQDLEKVKSERPELANDYVRILNEMYAQGRPKEDIKAFEKINSVGELKELPPLETMKLALQLRDGLTPEEADIRLKSLYKLDEAVYDEDTIAESKVNLKIDSKKDGEYLEQFKAKVTENPAKAQQQDFENQIAEYTAKVTPIAKSIQDSLTAIKGVNLNGKTGADAFITDLPLSDESRSKISDLVSDYASRENIPLDERGIQVLREFAENVAWISNKENFAIDIASKAEARVRAEFHNPSTISRGVDASNTDATVAAKQMEDFILGT